MTKTSFALSRRSLLSSAFATGLVSACGGGGEAKPRVRIGYQKNGVLLLAKRSGRLEQALGAEPAATLSWLEFSAGPPLLEAMGVGSLDLGSTGDAPPIFAQAAGAPLVYVAAVPLSGRAGGVLVPADSPAQSIADLRGKRFCFTRASSAHNSAAIILEQAGLSFDDVEQVHLAPADGAAAFAQGGLDAWLIWDPYFSVAIREQGARALGAGGLPPSAAYILAHRDFVEQSPGLLHRVLDGLMAEGRWASANRAEVAALMAQETGLPLELLNETVQRDDFSVEPMTLERIAAQQTTADRFLRLGLVPSAVTVGDAAYTEWTPA